MIRKFAAVPAVRITLPLIFLTILAGAKTLRAQQTSAQQTPAQQPSAQQTPDNQQSGIQEASPEETSSSRRTKPKEYKNWQFNIGGGASLTNGTTTKFVRGGGAIAAVGVARNGSKYLGLRVDFQWDNLPLRNSALQLAQAPGATSHVYSFSIDPIINIPVSKVWGGYIVGGPSFYHRSGKLDSSTAIPGSPCNAFFTWWGACYNGVSLPLSGDFLKSNQNEFGENFGFGVTRKVTPNLELYGEFRFFHGSHNNITTDLRPITVGIRW